MDVKKPRIILFDIESLPDLKQVMKYLPQIDDWPGQSLKAHINSVLCVGWKEFGSSRVNMIRAWDGPNWDKNKNDDRYVLEETKKVLESADAVVTHNGKRFDWPFIQTRLLIHGMEPLPKKTLHIDTKVIAKTNLRAISNRLNNVAELLSAEKKLENGGWELWEKVLEGDPKSLVLMEKYCKQDVRVLEQVFTKLRPFVTNIPNHNMFNKENTRCPNCGSLSLHKRGQAITQTKIYARLSCNDCGTWSRIAIKDNFPKL
jgi:DNA polymerase elongation subunit (family B)